MLKERENQLLLVDFEDKVATVSLNDPPANVLSQAMIEQLISTFQSFKKMDLAAVIVCGMGSHSFSAGADIRELAKNSPEQNRCYFARIYHAFKLISSCRLPVIAAVNGYAYGAGLELALCADIRVMDQNAKMSGTGVNLNLVFCTQRLLRLVGPGRAKDMLFQARQINADEALEIGLAEYVTPPGSSLEKAREISQIISQKGHPAVQLVKQVLNQGLDLSLEEALKIESEAITRMFATEEFKRRALRFLSRQKA